MDPRLVATLQLLTDPVRLRVLARLAEAPASLDELARSLELPVPAIARHVERLRAVGLVEARAAGFTFGRARLIEVSRELDALARELAALPAAVDPALGDLDPEDARVVRNYLDDEGRLTVIPASDRKRLPVLRWLRERVFTEYRGYPEKEVNQALALVHPDVASLRRYLVDAGLVTREGGIYWRTERDDGGSASADRADLATT